MAPLSIEPGDVAAPPVRHLVAALDAHLAALYPPESNHGLSLAELQGPDVRFVVARLGVRPVGCGALRLDAGFAEIKRMYVVPEARRRGIAHRLLAHLEALAAGNGRSLVRLETGIAQPEAIALYQRVGFQRIPPFPPYGPDPLSLFMEKALAAGEPAVS
jgi:putative acetyltransferase